MKRRIFLTLGVLLFVGLSTSVFAKTSVLIDFNLLKADGDGNPDSTVDASDVDYKTHPKELTQNMATLLDYSANAGSNFTEEDRKVMRTSLAPVNWSVRLNSSAATVVNKGYSFTKEWHTKYVNVLKTPDATSDEEPEGYTVLGIRVHFPESPFNSWALVKPPFEIPAYEDVWTDEKGKLKAEYEGQLAQDSVGNYVFDRSILTKEDKGTKYLSKGVVRNVGVLKSLEVAVYGCQFKNALSILLKDHNDVVTEIQMPQYLDFDGWRRITWNNPNYISEVSNRDLYIIPLYPADEPYLKLDGFRIYRQGDQKGGDFVTYIKDVVITYDEALNTREDLPIDHEEAWGILTTRREAAKRREFSRIGQMEILRYLEKQKMD